MTPCTAILALFLWPEFSLTDEDQDFYSPRPTEWIETERDLADVEFELIYRDALRRYEQSRGAR